MDCTNRQQYLLILNDSGYIEMNKTSRKLIFIVIFGIFCLVVFVHLLQNNFVGRLKLMAVTHPSLVFYTRNQVEKDFCNKAWELLTHEDPVKDLAAPLLDSDLAMKNVDINGCVLRFAATYSDSDKTERIFQTFTNTLMGIESDEVEIVQIESDKDGYIFLTKVYWDMSPPFLSEEGPYQSGFYVIVIRRCSSIAIVAMIVTREGEIISPGVKLSQQEIFEYGRQIDRRMKYLLCPH